MLTRPALLLRAEALFLLVLVVVLYRHLHANWGLFAALFLAPDLFMLGYLISSKIGTAAYNLGHTAAWPAVLAAAALFTSRPFLLPYALIWFAHIEFDRVVGYGLKYPDSFKHTHLQRLG